MKQIIIVKPGSLDEQSRKLLNQPDVVLIEHENPEEVRIVNLLDGLDGFDGSVIVRSMADALKDTADAGYTGARDRFGKYMITSLIKHLSSAKGSEE